jgi:TfoX/Sxy family transcriptional regulator of competence genes
LNDEAISRKKIFGSTGLSIGGKVFALLVKGKLVVKLPRERVETII